MSDLKITGTLKKKFEATTHGNDFTKIEFVVELPDDKYPQLIKMQSTQDRVSMIENMKVGSVATFYFNLKGREWESKTGEIINFTNIEVWKVSDQTPPQVSSNPPSDTEVETTTVKEGDELPF